MHFPSLDLSPFYQNNCRLSLQFRFRASCVLMDFSMEVTANNFYNGKTYNQLAAFQECNEIPLVELT
jgi:hypothetical protein